MKLIFRTILLTVVATLAFADHKVSPDTPATTPNGWMDVIVQFKVPPTKDQLKQFGSYGQLKKQFKSLNAIHLTLPTSVIQALAASPWVSYITPNRPTKSSLDIVTQTSNATMAWASGFDGSGVGVAILDSGVASKQDLMKKDK